jgi:endo-1,4-beta-xylanase
MYAKSGERLTRRWATFGLAAAAASAVVPVTDADIAIERLLPLRGLGRRSGLSFGCAARAPSVHPEPVLLKKIAAEANIFIPDAHLKGVITEPHANEFDFTAADSIAEFAARHAMVMHGHTLVWHEAIPDWVANISSARDARVALERHITTLVTRYHGRLWAWDVVNEPIEPKDGLDKGYRSRTRGRLEGAL